MMRQAYDVEKNKRFQPLGDMILNSVTGSMCAVSPSKAHPGLLFPNIRSTDWDTAYTPYVLRMLWLCVHDSRALLTTHTLSV